VSQMRDMGPHQYPAVRKDRSRSPSGMTTNKNNGKQKNNGKNKGGYRSLSAARRTVRPSVGG
jgi:hypothetical protein